MSVARAGTLAAFVLLAAGCAERRTADDDGGAARDSGGAAAKTTGATAAATPATHRPFTAAIEDTLTGLGVGDPPDSTFARSVAVAVPDSGEVVPTDAELSALHAELAMPLPNVSAADLPDTFLEARGSRVHHALDIPAPRGTPVLSAAPGRVLKLFTSVAGGLMVYAADSANRFVLMYAHLDSYAPGLADGQPLARGQTIGAVGTTGNAPPNVPHLHFAIARPRDVARWWTGTPVDPRPLLVPTVP
ncbi:MAG TPA: M23 family metallopeptidase [Gemmatimonadaceae bacterium]|nr:M23 family metallopeptidase [Gemmatimonadaceae bacterium]